MIEDYVKATDFLDFPIKIDMVYKNEFHKDNVFGKVYHDNAQIYVFKELMAITLIASLILNKKYDFKLKINDCLRTIDAQIKMEKTAVLKNWPQELISKPTTGMHPKGLAIDIELIDKNDNLIEMGSKFDEFSANPNKFHNKAHREYVHLTKEALDNRKILDNAMLDASKVVGLDLLPLLCEWWDFRFSTDIFGLKILYDADLPLKMRQIKENLCLDEVEIDDKLAFKTTSYVRDKCLLLK